jgi:hypothetical protein
MFARHSLERLEDWLSKLEEQYVQLALMIAQYEGEHDLAAFNDTHTQLDRLEVDMERAKRAIKLAKKHALNRQGLKAITETHMAAEKETV